MRILTTELKKYKWTYSNKLLTVSDKNGQSVVLDKIGFMSLSRFILRVLDSMRIDESKRLKSRLQDLRLKTRESIQEKKALKKELKEKSR